MTLAWMNVPRRLLVLAGFLVAALLLDGCGEGSASDADNGTGASAAREPVTGPSGPKGTVSTSGPETESSPAVGQPGGGTVVRFESPGGFVDVRITADDPATRDFLSMLPLTLSFEEFSGREKIAYLPRELETEGAPGGDPEDGNLIYFVPWGNLGFYYDAEGVGYSEDTIVLGRYRASAEQLAGLEQGDVTVHLADG